MIRSALTLVQRVTHLNERVSKLEGWKDEYDPAYDLWAGYQVLAMLASKATGEVYEACQRFKTVTKSDPVVTAALAAHHEIAPLGPRGPANNIPTNRGPAMTATKRRKIDPARHRAFVAMDALCDAIHDVEGFVALLQLLETHSAGDKVDAVTFLEPKIVQSAANLRAAYEHAHQAVFARKADTAR